jgi:hypothetical protein
MGQDRYRSCFEISGSGDAIPFGYNYLNDITLMNLLFSQASVSISACFDLVFKVIENRCEPEQ